MSLFNRMFASNMMTLLCKSHWKHSNTKKMHQH